MNAQLLLDSIRSVLARLEETIIFGLIERAQFRRNPAIYAPGHFPPLGGGTLMDHLLHETEVVHARMRRYTSPDEHPFTDNLPAPLLPAMRFDENPLRPNRININTRIRADYIAEMVPRICEDGDDGQYGSSAVCDVANLQALSRRVHYGKFVAESKWRAMPDAYTAAARAGARAEIERLLTDEAVEADVLRRVHRKAETYMQLLPAGRGAGRLTPAAVEEIYRHWIIPLNKQVQVEYLLGREAGENRASGPG